MDEIKGTVKLMLVIQTLLGMLIGSGITALVMVSSEEPEHFPEYTERLDQCEALLGKAVNLTTKCVNQREKEKCEERKENNVR
jgi:hypothetical protein